MAEYRIHFTTGTSATVCVEADDLDAAIDAAYEELPGSICAQCSGWGKKWTREEGDFEVDESAHEVDGEYVEVKS